MDLKFISQEETLSYDLRIPAIPEIAERVGCKPLTKHNWFIDGQPPLYPN